MNNVNHQGDVCAQWKVMASCLPSIQSVQRAFRWEFFQSTSTKLLFFLTAGSENFNWMLIWNAYLIYCTLQRFCEQKWTLNYRYETAFFFKVFISTLEICPNVWSSVNNCWYCMSQAESILPSYNHRFCDLSTRKAVTKPFYLWGWWPPLLSQKMSFLFLCHRYSCNSRNYHELIKQWTLYPPKISNFWKYSEIVLSENYRLSHVTSGTRRKMPVLILAWSFGGASHSWQLWDNTHFRQAEKRGGAARSSPQKPHLC